VKSTVLRGIDCRSVCLVKKKTIQGFVRQWLKLDR